MIHQPTNPLRFQSIVTEDSSISKLPYFFYEQLLNPYSFSFAHAQFVWDCKSELGVRDIFAKVWGTERLTISFGKHERCSDC
jgi:hypothetical protein